MDRHRGAGNHERRFVGVNGIQCGEEPTRHIGADLDAIISGKNNFHFIQLPESPVPLALRKASLQVQHLKNAWRCSSDGSPRSAAASRAVKNRSAISSNLKPGLRYSISTPTSPIRLTASKAISLEWERLNSMPPDSNAGGNLGLPLPPRSKYSRAGAICK